MHSVLCLPSSLYFQCPSSNFKALFKRCRAKILRLSLETLLFKSHIRVTLGCHSKQPRRRIKTLSINLINNDWTFPCLICLFSFFLSYCSINTIISINSDSRFGHWSKLRWPISRFLNFQVCHVKVQIEQPRHSSCYSRLASSKPLIVGGLSSSSSSSS